MLQEWDDTKSRMALKFQQKNKFWKQKTLVFGYVV